MPPKSSQPAKKQASISSFFAPKSSQPSSTSSPSTPKTPVPKKTPTPQQQKPPTPTPPTPEAIEQDEDEENVPQRPTRPVRSRSKRVLDESTPSEDDEDDYNPKPKKARKADTPASRTPASRTPASRASPVSTPISEAPPSTQSASRPPKVTQRTERFLYGSQASQADLTPEKVAQKERNHTRFIEKLGRGQLLKGYNPDDQDENEGAGGEEDDEMEVEEEEPAPKKKGGKAAAKGAPKKKKLTPMEQQVVDLKQKYPDTVLVVEVGYKYRFFGEDARIAANVLSIFCIPGKMHFDSRPEEAHLDKFASASIPVHRLHVHVKRLVEAGYKVGVVRQLETAALKAAGDNKYTPFVRKLTNLYTKGTYIDDLDDIAGTTTAVGDASAGGHGTGFLLSLTEKLGGGNGADERVKVGIVAVQPSTGDIVYDEFEDGFMRGEIETRLLHISPCEMLIVGELSAATEKLVKHLAGGSSALGAKVRLERISGEKNSISSASAEVSKFYAGKLAQSSGEEATEKNALLESVGELPDLVLTCLAAMIKHLTEYGLEHIFDLTKYFQPFSARSHMLLNANTLSSLEIYKNQTDYTEAGSLFWCVDRTKTRFGKRLLRNWVGRPLLDKKLLESRLAAVEEVLERKNPNIEKLKSLLGKVQYDLEKGLIRIYYGRCGRPELLAILQALRRMASEFPLMDNPSEAGFRSDELNRAISSLPLIRKDVEEFLNVFNHQAAAKDDKYNFFNDEMGDYDDIASYKCLIADDEHELNEHLREIAKALDVKSKKYMTVSGVEYLIEVDNNKKDLAKVPASWIKVNGTKKTSRFHTPKVVKFMQQRDQHKEALAAACDTAYKSFLARISTQYQPLRDCIQSLAYLDCILSLATVASQPGYCKPTFVDEPILDIQDGRHPMIERLLLDTYVPNSVSLKSSGLRALLITGPNMGGKSSFVRSLALTSILAQMGSYVPAASARLGLLDAVYTRMGAFDNLLKGESTFMVELSETAEILKTATSRSLVILDELGRGTSTSDGVAIANAVLEFVVKDIGAMCLFVTHYPSLGKVAERFPGEVGCAHMGFIEENSGVGEGEGGEKKITFLYKVKEGMAYRSYGLNVGRLAGLPAELLKRAEIKSQELEGVVRGRERVGVARGVGKVCQEEGAGEGDTLGRLMDALEIM